MWKREIFCVGVIIPFQSFLLIGQPVYCWKTVWVAKMDKPRQKMTQINTLKKTQWYIAYSSSVTSEAEQTSHWKVLGSFCVLLFYQRWEIESYFWLKYDEILPQSRLPGNPEKVWLRLLANLMSLGFGLVFTVLPQLCTFLFRPFLSFCHFFYIKTPKHLSTFYNMVRNKLFEQSTYTVCSVMWAEVSYVVF